MRAVSGKERLLVQNVKNDGPSVLFNTEEKMAKFSIYMSKCQNVKIKLFEASCILMYLATFELICPSHLLQI